MRMLLQNKKGEKGEENGKECEEAQIVFIKNAWLSALFYRLRRCV